MYTAQTAEDTEITEFLFVRVPELFEIRMLLYFS
jgi:hypothetical protein